MRIEGRIFKAFAHAMIVNPVKPFLNGTVYCRFYCSYGQR